MESLIKEGQEDTGYENHPTRSCPAVARRARAVAFYSLQQCGSPRGATGHLWAWTTLGARRISEKDVTRGTANRFLRNLLKLTAN